MAGDQEARPPGGQAAQEAASVEAPVGIGSSLYSSDAFRIWCFKVLPCSKRYVHEWTSCPFAHPGEKAKRRDPRTHQYDCEMCPAVVRGETCELGHACPHSHHVFESWLHPQKYRTLICKDGANCHREVCFFAHGTEQLRTPNRDPLPVQQQQHHHHNQHNHHNHHLPPRGMQQPPHVAAAALAADGGAMTRQPSLGASWKHRAPAQPHGGNSAPSLARSASLRSNGGSACADAGSGGPDALPTLAQLAAGGTDLAQLVSSLVHEVHASKQEAQESRRAAAAAQQQLAAFQEAVGRTLSGCSTGDAGGAPAAASQRGSPVLAGGAVLASAELSGQHAVGLVPQDPASSSGCGSCRTSFDEAAATRAAPLVHAPGGSGGAAAGSPCMLWSPVQQADAELSSSGMLPLGGGCGSGSLYSCAAPLPAPVDASSSGSLLPYACVASSSSASAGQLAQPPYALHPAPLSQPQVCVSAYGPLTPVSGAPALGGVVQPLLPAMPAPGGSGQQLQSDYLLQLQHMVLHSAPVITSLHGLQQEPGLQGFDSNTYAQSMPLLPSWAAGAGAAATVVLPPPPPAAGAGAADVLDSRSSCTDASCIPPPVAISERLATNPIGGADQLGWL